MGRQVDTSVQKAALADAFMRMDAELSATQAAIEDCRSTGNTDIIERWQPVDIECHRLSEVYLSLIGDGDITVGEIEQGIDLLNSTSRELVEFRARNARDLNAAKAFAAEVTAMSREAQDAAIRSFGSLDGLPTEFKAYASVRDAGDLLSRAVDQHRAAHTYPDIIGAARCVTEAAESLDAAVRAAPMIATNASRELMSVSTRITSARNRFAGIASAMSALLREFPEASSIDLRGNGSIASTHISRATDCLGRARAAEHNGEPEIVLALISQARAELTQAEKLSDAVPDRLSLLRSLREHPEKPAEKARFTLRDARMYAENRGITGQWGSALSAQLQRIERIENSLNTPHPDYWGYVTDLTEVQQFLRSLITKMRERNSQ